VKALASKSRSKLRVRPKTIAFTGSTFALKAAYVPVFCKRERGTTYIVGAAVRADVCGQRNGSAEAEDDTKRIHGDVHNRDAELVDEGCRQEVQQCEQPPYTDEQRVVDDRVCAPVSARNDVTHERGNENSADQLDIVNEALRW
jgi:hypothetical protein